MDRLKILKILMQIFITHPSTRLAWNTAVISVGLGSAYMLFFLNPNAPATSYTMLAGPLIVGLGVISFIVFARLFVSLVLINFFRFILSRGDITEYLESYGYYPGNRLKRTLAQLDKACENEIKKIERSGLSRANQYGIREKYAAMKAAAEKEDRRRHIESSASFKWTPLYFYWWSSRPWRWSVYMFFIVNSLSTYHMFKNTPFIIWKSSAGLNLSIIYAVIMGSVFLMLYSVFRINTNENLKYDIPRFLKGISMFFIGMTLGLFVFNYTITGFVNERFGTEKTAEVTAKYWRQSARWCHGLEVHYYDVPKFFYTPDIEHAERIICFSEKYKHAFKKDSIILAHGPGTILGMNIKAISSPDNHIDRMASPEWD